MKTIKYLFFVAMATLLMAADCSNKDSEFYNDVFVTSPNLVSITKSDIPEDQTIFINASIPKLLTVATLSKPLDIFKTTGGATKLNFSYELEKKNTDGNWEYIEFESSNVATTEGVSQIGSFVVGSAVFNAVTNNYEYQANIQNLLAGNYRLSFGYNSSSANIVEFRSESVGDNLFLNLDSPSTALDTQGYYLFTVN